MPVLPRLAALAAALALAAPAGAWAADRTDAGAPEHPSARTDCRYLSTEDRPTAQAPEPLHSEPFPADDVFRPLLADPKTPQFFASYERAWLRNPRESLDVASVGFGEYFGLWGRRQPSGCDGFQVGLAGGVFSQFNLDAPSFDLINTDYIIGLPLSLRRGLFSARLRLYHQSSHLGDEFLLTHPGIQRVNLSYEAVELIGSMERRWARLYAGGAYLFDQDPSTLKPWHVQWGAELRGPGFPSPFSGKALGEVRLVPVLGADFKAFEELGWTVNSSLVGGIEWSSERTTRRLRLLVTYYYGYNPYGQFFNRKVQTLGVGLYFAF